MRAVHEHANAKSGAVVKPNIELAQSKEPMKN